MQYIEAPFPVPYSACTQRPVLPVYLACRVIFLPNCRTVKPSPGTLVVSRCISCSNLGKQKLSSVESGSPPSMEFVESGRHKGAWKGVLHCLPCLCVFLPLTCVHLMTQRNSR